MPETPVTDTAVYNPRPTVRLNGEEAEKISGLILGMDYVEREGGPSAMELRFSNVATDLEGGADFAFEDDSVLKLGAAIAVYGGDNTAPREIFQGTVTGIEAEFSQDAPPELVVLAEDPLQNARMTRRSALHEGGTIASIASSVAQHLNLTPVVNGFTDDVGLQVQWNESDLGFLQRLLCTYHGDLQVVGRELHVSPRGDVERGALELEMNSQLLRARFLADLAHQATEVTLSGWNVTDGRRVQATSQGAQIGPGNGRRGSAILEDTLGARNEHVGHLAVLNDTEATAFADAAFDRRARSFIRVEGTAVGNPAVRVGTHVKLIGVGPRFSNTYYVTEVCHRFDEDRGYECDFRAECAFLGGAS